MQSARCHYLTTFKSDKTFCSSQDTEQREFWSTLFVHCVNFVVLRIIPTLPALCSPYCLVCPQRRCWPKRCFKSCVVLSHMRRMFIFALSGYFHNFTRLPFTTSVTLLNRVEVYLGRRNAIMIGQLPRYFPHFAGYSLTIPIGIGIGFLR